MKCLAYEFQQYSTFEEKYRIVRNKQDSLVKYVSALCITPLYGNCLENYISFLIATIVACITSFKYETKLNQVRLTSFARGSVGVGRRP